MPTTFEIETSGEREGLTIRAGRKEGRLRRNGMGTSNKEEGGVDTNRTKGKAEAEKDDLTRVKAREK